MVWGGGEGGSYNFVQLFYYYFNKLFILFKWNDEKYKNFDVWGILKLGNIIGKIGFWSVFFFLKEKKFRFLEC